MCNIQTVYDVALGRWLLCAAFADNLVAGHTRPLAGGRRLNSARPVASTVHGPSPQQCTARRLNSARPVVSRAECSLGCRRNAAPTSSRHTTHLCGVQLVQELQRGSKALRAPPFKLCCTAAFNVDCFAAIHATHQTVLMAGLPNSRLLA